MSSITTYEKLEQLGRTRLSKHFFMRDFLHSEIAAWHGLRNVPDHPQRAVETGRMLCEQLLEPLQATFGRIHVRSGYRSPQVNQYGNEHKLNCASNENNFARHIWDYPDASGKHGAMACIVLPWLVDHMAKGGSWTAMAWWIHDHLPYSSLYFFSKLGAFNIGWHEVPERRIDSFAPPKGCLTRPGMANHGGMHAGEYPGFPALVGTGGATAFRPIPASTSSTLAVRTPMATPSPQPPSVAKTMNTPNHDAPAPTAATTTMSIASIGGKVLYRAIHTKTKWRKVSSHQSLQTAINGKDGAAGLLHGKARIDYAKHGEPLYVLAWEEGANHGYAIKRSADGKGIRTVQVPKADLLGFESRGQASASELERYF